MQEEKEKRAQKKNKSTTKKKKNYYLRTEKLGSWVVSYKILLPTNIVNMWIPSCQLQTSAIVVLYHQPHIFVCYITGDTYYKRTVQQRGGRTRGPTQEQYPSERSDEPLSYEADAYAANYPEEVNTG